MKTFDFRVDVLRHGVPFTQLTFSSTPSVFCNSEARIKMSMRGSFLFNKDVDYIRDEIRPVVTINGVDHPSGVFRIVTRSSRFDTSGVQYDTIEAYDRTIALTWAKLEQRRFYPAGSSYDSIISGLLLEAGITNVISEESGLVLQNDRSDWEVGTDFLTIINDLLDEMNYNALWCDTSGFVRLTPYKTPSVRSIDHQYTAREAVFSGAVSQETDLYNKPNVFIAIVQNPEYTQDGEPWIATAVNDSPASRLSTINRGIRIPEITYVPNIASKDALQKYVDRIRNESMQTYEDVSITTAIMPGHNVGDVVALVHPAINGIFKEISWQVTMQPGASMTHKLRRVVVV